MGLELLNLESVAGIDAGRIAIAFEHELQACIADCKNRPALDKARTVTLKISLVPVLSQDKADEMESCYVDFQVSHAVPKKDSKSYNMQSTPSGLVFNEMSPDDVRQLSLDMAQKPKAVANAR